MLNEPSTKVEYYTDFLSIFLCTSLVYRKSCRPIIYDFHGKITVGRKKFSQEIFSVW